MNPLDIGTELKIISDAEWEIMRIVWAKTPVTSSTIISELEHVTGWMPTTVKTFLSRLVKKEILQFEKKGRTFYYYPLVSEEKCIRDELQAVVEKVYGGSLNHVSEHFIFKGSPDTPHIINLAKALESQYAKITGDLQQTLSEPLLIYLHTSQARLHSALGVLGGPKWLRAGHIWGLVHLAPKVCFDDISAECVAIHTFTLFLLQKINPAIPYWLQQGIATYESGWMTEERIRQLDLFNQDQQAFTQMQVMHHAYLSFKEAHGYELGYTVVDFIVKTYGMEKLAAFVRSPYDYEGVFGEKESEFWEKWRVASKLSW